MTQDMKKDMILHTIAKLVVPLKRTMSPLEADSHSAPGRHFFNRSLLLLLLMLIHGIGSAWGQDTDYSGTYYIANNDKSNYKGYDNADNYYLCPAQEYFVEDGLTTTSESNGKPFLTTNQTTQAENALWIVERITVNNKKYYIFKHKDGENYKYLTVNDALTGYSKKHRKRVHLEELTPATLTDKNYFNIELITTASGIKGYSISYYKNPNGTTNKFLNPAGGNHPSYSPTELNNESPTTSGGMVGFFTQGTTSGDGMGSVWFFEVPKPVIHIDENNKLTFSCVNEDVTFHYTINGEDPSATDSNIYDEDAENVLEDGHHTIKVMAVMNSGNTGYASGVVTQEVTIISTSISYLIQSKESPFYYLIPNLKVGDTDYPKNLTTLNVPCSTMVWNFEDAADNDGRYYYIHNSQGGYLYYTTSDNSNNYVYFNSTKDTDDDGYKFSITPHASGGFNIIPKGQTTPINKPSIEANNDGDRLSPVKLTGAVGDITSRWTLIPYTSTASLPQWTDVPFAESTDDVTHYYKIVSDIQTTKPLILDNSGDVKSETVPTTSYDVRKAMWVIKKVDSDTDGLLDYYTFKNAYTGELLYYNGKGRGIKDSAPVLQMGMPSTEGADATWSHFVVVQTVSGYNIIPRAIVDNTKSISRVGTGDYTDGKGFNCINRASGNDSPGTWYDNDGGSRWTFEEQTNVTCMEPVFTEEENGDITITSVTNGAKIRYTDDGTDPTQSSAEYTTKENTSVQKIIKAIAIMGNDASTESNVVTLLNKPDITLAAGPYTYKGTAWEPEITKVSIGETEAPTTPVATYSVTSSSYSNNINAGENTALVTLMDANATDTWYFMNASTTFTIEKAPLTVTANNHNITYGDEPTGSGVEYSGFVNGETESVLGGTLDFEYNYSQYGDASDENHIYTITPQGLTSDNYSFTFVPGTLTVNRKEVGLDWSETSLVYNGTPQAPTASASNPVPGDEIGVTVSGAETNAGSYTAAASGLTGTKAGNYSLPAENSQSFTISPKPVTVSGITVSDKIYDGTTDATIDNSEAAIYGIVSGDNLSVASVTGTFDTKDVGTNKTVTVVITTEGTSADNYELSASGLTADITPKPLTIKANDNAIGYGTAAVDNGVTYDSFVLGEDESLLEGTLTYVFNTSADGTGDAYTTSSPKGTYYIIPGGLHLPDGNNNYAISFAYGTLTVGPRKIGNGTDFAEGFTVNIDTSTSPYALTVYDGSTALIQGTTGTDYDYSIDTSESTDKYYVATITGANNYSDAVADRAIVKYANVRFDSDGSPGAMWYGTFVAEADHVTPTGMTPYIITSVADNTATAVELDYIPNGVPVVLMNAEDAKGFLVQSGTGEISTTGNLLAVQATDEEKATATVYLLYKGEFVLNKAGTLKAGTVYLPVSAGGGSGARLKISRGGNTGIENIEYTIKPQSDAWYTLDGRRLSSKPTKKGLYLQGGKKIVVK